MKLGLYQVLNCPVLQNVSFQITLQQDISIIFPFHPLFYTIFIICYGGLYSVLYAYMWNSILHKSEKDVWCSWCNFFSFPWEKSLIGFQLGCLTRKSHGPLSEHRKRLESTGGHSYACTSYLGSSDCFMKFGTLVFIWHIYATIIHPQ